MKWKQGKAGYLVTPNSFTVITVFIRPEVRVEYREEGDWMHKAAWDWTVVINGITKVTSRKRAVLANAQDKAFKAWRRWDEGER